MTQIELWVNGNKHQLLVDEHDTLSFILRNKIQLTGTKVACEQGYHSSFKVCREKNFYY